MLTTVILGAYVADAAIPSTSASSFAINAVSRTSLSGHAVESRIQYSTFAKARNVFQPTHLRQVLVRKLLRVGIINALDIG